MRIIMEEYGNVVIAAMVALGVISINIGIIMGPIAQKVIDYIAFIL